MSKNFKSTKFFLTVLSLILLTIVAWKDTGIFVAGLTVTLGFYGATNISEKRINKTNEG